MIIGELKPIEEIADSISAFGQVSIVGCGSCVTVCLSGGDREAKLLSRELSLTRYYRGEPPRLNAATIQRQCERDLVDLSLDLPPDTEAVLSLACGAGVQTLSDAFDRLPVIPALNTTFLGAADAPGVWHEKCRGCGDCILASTGGICPVGRCAKNIFNGPCGGSQDGRCEVDPETPCAWLLIYHRLKDRNMLHLLSEVRPPRDWRLSGGNGPRVRRRTGTAPPTPSIFPR